MMSPRLRELKESWRVFVAEKVSLLATILALFFILIAIFAPLIAPYDPWEMVGERLVPPCTSHILGTDDIGRDIFSQIIWGTRVSLLVGFLAAATSTIIGVLVGSISGYVGGKTGDLMMRMTDMFMVIPRFFLLLVVVAIYGGNIWLTILVIGILSWPSTARITRSMFLSIKESNYVLAAKILGISDRRIIFNEILPNAISPIIVTATLQIPFSIIMEAGLSFLGLGDPNLMGWGYMLNNAQRFIRVAWWMPLFPGLALVGLSVVLNLVGEGINYAVNPKLREG